jgi:hypothetical protein
VSRGRVRGLAVLAVALTYASLPQGIGWNQNAHYALVRALADGTPVIDRYRAETGDVSLVDGHYYASKAPGLALATVAPFVVLDTAGVRSAMARVPGASDSTVGMLWALGLVGVVLPGALLLLLVRRLAESLEPGLGTAAAVAAGLGTLLLPFGTLFFAHVLSATLGFAAFALLWLERRRDAPARLGVVAVSGLLAGLAITTEYPLAVVAVIVGAYAVSTGALVRRAAAYAAGVAVGILPLLAYNWWAFGSPATLSIANAVGQPGHFGLEAPSVSTAVELLFGRVGLLRMTPVVALGAVGAALLYRRGQRAEALVIAGVAIAFLVWNSAYFDPFGGFSPGPRFLTPILPFLAVPLALTFARLPVTTVALSAVSVLLMVAVTISGPLLAFDGRWHERIADGWFSGRSFGVVVPFLLLATTAVVLACRATGRLHVSRREAAGAALAVAGWAFLAVLSQPGF